MRTERAMAAGSLMTLVLLVAGAVGYSRTTRLSARETPGWFETWVARSMRSIAVSPAVRALRNPEPASPEDTSHVPN